MNKKYLKFSLIAIIVLTILIISVTYIVNKDKNTLIMATEAGFAPFEYYENGDIVGVDVEIAKAIADELNLELVIKDIAFDNLINELNSGRSDFVAAGLSITPERAEEVDFTIEYITSNQVVVVNQNSNISSIEDIGDLRIGTQLGSTADFYVSDNYKNSNHTTYKKYLSAVEELLNNKIDLLIMDSLPAELLIQENDNLKILDGILFQDKYGMAVKKGNLELLDSINIVLEKLINEGKINEYVIKHSE